MASRGCMLAAVEGTGVVEINVTTGERKVLVPHPSYVIGLAHAACGKIPADLGISCCSSFMSAILCRWIGEVYGKDGPSWFDSRSRQDRALFIFVSAVDVELETV